MPVERVVFNAVTKEAVLDAMQHPRAIDGPLVNAYLARRALDYLVGFTLSPVLWRKLPGARSAGRVQSVALRLVCDRELEIEKFKAQEYWTILAELATAKNETFQARLSLVDGKKLDKFDIPDQATAEAPEGRARRRPLQGLEHREQGAAPPPGAPPSPPRPCSRRPRASSASRRATPCSSPSGSTKASISAARPKASSPICEPTACRSCRRPSAAVRRLVTKLYGDRYVPATPRQYETKAKNAQEAHEAIRPTDFSKEPDKVSRYLDDDAARLYKLIWQRTLASQASSAEIERTTAEIDVTGKDGKPYGVRATGSVIRFDGFLKIYEEGIDDAIGEDGALPALAKGDALDPREHRGQAAFHRAAAPL